MSNQKPANAIYAQSGGVTSVINASALGVINTAKKYPKQINKVFAGKNGILGVLNEELIDISLEPEESLQQLIHTPSGAFGSCRHKLKNFEENEKEYYIDFSISTLPSGYTEYSKAADIHISKDGKFLYASNRGHESIVIFEVNSEDGTLKTIGFESVLGEQPRNFSLSPDEEFLLVANQDTDNIISFKRDSLTGKLTFVSEISAPTPVCILF